MEMSCYHTALEILGFYVAQISANYVHQPKNKDKTSCENIAKAGQRVIIPVKRVLYHHGLKSPSVRKNPLRQKLHKKARLQLYTETKPLMFGDMSYGLLKL